MNGSTLVDPRPPAPAQQWCKPRARKVTITEIIESSSSGDEDFSSSDCEEREGAAEAVAAEEETTAMAVDEKKAFELLEAQVRDWKVKLELVAGDGLKRIRKSGMEKRAALREAEAAGDEQAKVRVVKEWRNEFMRNMALTQRRVEKLNDDAGRATDELIEQKIFKKFKKPPAQSVVDRRPNSTAEKKAAAAPAMQQNKKTIVNLEFDSGDCSGGGGDAYGSLRQLAKELESVCSLFQDGGVGVPTIYDMKPASPARQAAPHIDQMGKMARQITQQKHPQILSAKAEKRETHVVRAQRKMLERKQERKREQNQVDLGSRYRVVQVKSKKGGGEKYFVVKRKEKKIDNGEGVEAEDVFAEWIRNLEAPRRARAVKNKRRRIRRATHRSVRKKMLKIKREEDERKGGGVRSYADVLKKNLRNLPRAARESTPAEDIFRAWRSNLREESSAGQGAAVDYADIFKVWRHNLKSERSYDVRTTKPAWLREEDVLFTAMAFQKELRLAEAHFGAGTTCYGKINGILKASELVAAAEAASAAAPGPAVKKRKVDYGDVEDIFGSWRHNLEEKQAVATATKKKKKKSKPQPPMAENIFHDWLANLEVPGEYFQRKKIEDLLKDDLSPLPPKQQQSKKGKKNKKGRK